MDIQEDDIVQIVTDIWTSMLGIDAEFAGAGGELKSEERVLAASVQINGDWQGVITVICSEHLARQFAGTMLDMDPVKIDRAEVHDAIGELANITGGNLKSLVDGFGQLSLPVVTEGLELAFSIPGSKVVSNLAFHSGDETFSILIVAKAD
ncbi:MAG: chemotaxis protein CheX [Acidimicrobiales bacterium]